jgi:hypothetical protein
MILAAAGPLNSARIICMKMIMQMKKQDAVNKRHHARIQRGSAQCTKRRKPAQCTVVQEYLLHTLASELLWCGWLCSARYSTCRRRPDTPGTAHLLSSC